MRSFSTWYPRVWPRVWPCLSRPHCATKNSSVCFSSILDLQNANIKPVDIFEQHLARARFFERGGYNLTHRIFDCAERDEQSGPGMLHKVPFTFATYDSLTHALVEAGAKPIASTNQEKYSFNPHNPEVWSGGLHGGAAGCVAVGIGAFSVASDTPGDSVRVAASCCGVVGLKTDIQRGLFGSLGILARSVSDATLVYTSLWKDAHRALLWRKFGRKMRIGYWLPQPSVNKWTEDHVDSMIHELEEDSALELVGMPSFDGDLWKELDQVLMRHDYEKLDILYHRVIPEVTHYLNSVDYIITSTSNKDFTAWNPNIFLANLVNYPAISIPLPGPTGIHIVGRNLSGLLTLARKLETLGGYDAACRPFFTELDEV